MGGNRRSASRWLVGWGDDIGYAVRSLRRNPGYALFAVVTLALGIGASSAIFGAVQSVLLTPYPYEAAERMYTLFRPYGPSALLSPRLEQIEAWRGERDVFETIELVSSQGRTLTGRGAAEGVQVALVRPGLFDVLDLSARLGRTLLPDDVADEGRRVVLLTHETWRSRFGSDRDVLGQGVTLDGEPWTVVGVLPPHAPLPTGFDSSIDFWAPLPMSPADRFGSVLAVAREGVTREEVEARLDLVQARAVAAGESEDAWGGAALSVTEERGSRLAEPLRILMAATALLLLIACVNVANLLLSRSTTRRHETAVRRAIGASRRRMVRQLLVEAVFLGCAGAALGVAVAYGWLEIVRWLRPEDLAILDEIRIDERVLALTALAGVVCGIAFGTLPAWQGSLGGGLDALRSGTRLDRAGAGGGGFRWLLVGSEVALSFALLVGSVTAVRALVELQRREPGFEAEGLLVVDVTLPGWKYGEDALRAEALLRMRERLAEFGGVADLAMSTALPPKTQLWIGRIQAEGREASEERKLLFGPHTDANYHRVLGIEILAGRAFTPEEVRTDAPVTILSERSARWLFGEENPVGERMSLDEGETWRTIVGVAVDIRMKGLASDDDDLQHYQPMAPRWRSAAYALRLAPGADPGAVLASARQILRAEEPDLLFGDAAPVDDLMRATAARERFTSALLASFAALAVLLAAIGLYGVVSQAVGRRTREIGIRVSLGAAGADIRRLVLGGGARATVAGIALGALVAWVGMRALQSQIFGIADGQAVGSYGLAAVLLAAITLAACWIPARRAARVDPVDALRRE